MDEDPAQEPPESFATRVDRHPRLQGLAGLAIGLAMAHSFIYEPLVAAERIAAQRIGGTVTVHATWAGFSVFIALLGVVFLIGGERAVVWTGNKSTSADPLHEQLPARQVAFLLVGLALSFGVSTWLEQKVKRLVTVGKPAAVAAPETSP